MAAVIFIVRTLLGLLTMLFLMRMLLPLAGADARNPLSQGIIRFTNPLVAPLRRMVPAGRRFDGAALLALLLVQVTSTVLVLLLRGSLPMFPAVLWLSLRELLSLLLQFYFVVLLLYAVLSWVAAGVYSPASSVITSLARPVLRPFQRVVPPIAGLDLSVLFALIAIQALQILLKS